MTGSQGFYGQQGLTDAGSDFNRHSFAIKQELGNVRTGMPVKVIAVHGGGIGAAPTVDVQPLINQIDGQGNSTPHGTIFGIPVSRSQGGGNAIINDPVAGDVGWMAVSDRDISSLKANAGAQSNPGSFRRFSPSDGVYHGAILNPANPTQYVAFTATGIVIFDKNGNTITMGPSGINMNGVVIDNAGNLSVPGNITVQGGVTGGAGGPDSVTLQHHTHGGGSQPTPGT